MTATRSPLHLLLLGLTALLTILFVATGTLWLLDEVAADEQRQVRPLPRVAELSVDADAGDVRVLPAARGERPTLETIERRGLFGGPDVELTERDGHVEARSDCDEWVPGVRCNVQMVLRVPEGTPVRIQTGSGDVVVAGVNGPASVSTGSGDVDVERSGGVVTVETGSGDIDVDRVRGAGLTAKTGSGEVDARNLAVREIRLRTGSGDVDVEAGSVPRRLEARTGSGELRVSVPDVAYAIELETGSGDEEIGVAQDPSSPYRMRLDTGSGDVTVTPR